MIIQNISPTFLSIIENSTFAFSENSRFIYVSNSNRDIIVYDSKFNKYIVLKADATIIEYLKQIKGFRMDSSMLRKPYIDFVNENTLIISFNWDAFDFYENGYSALLILIRLNFSTKTFSMIDKLIYTHCYYSYLLKDGSQYALLHISEAMEDMDDGNLYRCYMLEINENQISQVPIDPFIFDYNYISLASRPNHFHLHENKIWFFREAESVQIVLPSGQSDYQFIDHLAYFDLNEISPIKETRVDLLNQDAYTSFIDGYLFYFPNQYEYEMLNLHTKGWINGKNNIELQKINDRDLKLINFATQRSKYNFYNVDSQFDVTVIDKTTKRLLLVPLKTPQKLYDIAWITALNAGLLNQNESKLPKNLKYQTVF